MRIGIDIDDTITDSWPSVMEIMCRDFNRDVNEVISSKLIYEKITGLSFDDYLITKAQLAKLKSFAGNHLKCLNCGAHLGFLYRKVA